ncbi:MAG: TraR/DksA C4-type zinc finger protein [Clostridiales bacterium]|nr:TraR/DksA C4-type zinc finger protein [Clostridiales bacterium]
MDETTRHSLREHLESQLARLQTQVETIEREGHEALSEASGENNYRDHMADQGSATFDRELDLSLEENVRDSLAVVRHALARMDQGSYGMCEQCGVEIPGARLEAMPTATLCIICKSAEESR